MKKVFLLASVIALTAFASCGNKQNAATTTSADSVEVATPAEDDVVSTLDAQLQSKDPKALQETITTITQKYAELAKEGKLEEAKAYAAKAQAYLKEHASEVTAVAGENSEVSKLVNTVANLPTSAQTTAEEAVKAVETTAKSAVETVKAGAASEVEAVKTDAQNKVEAVKTDTKNKANEAAAKVNSKINEKTTEANKKANDAVNKAASKALKGLGL